MNLSREKIKSLIRNIPSQTKFLLSNRSQKLLVEGKQLFVSPYGLGDTFLLCLHKDTWEAKNRRDIHFGIKSSHKFILEFCGIQDFTVMNTNELPLHILGFKNPWTHIDENKIFIAHMLFHQSYKPYYEIFNSGKLNLGDLYNKFLGVEKNAKVAQIFLDSVTNHPVNIPGFRQDKTIFLVPNANTIKTRNELFWNEIRTRAIKQGFDVLENGKDVVLYQGSSSKIIDITLKDLTAAAFKCHFTLTLRSGLSDFFHLKPNSIVIYPNELSLKQFSINSMYGSNIHEFVLTESDEKNIDGVLSLISNNL